MEIEMEYLTQVITAPITHTTDASKKEMPVQHSSSLLLIGLGTKRDKEIER
jgi:hypothetical protein